MPELPEVETTIRDLFKKVVSQKIDGCWTDLPSKVFLCSKFSDKNPGEIIKDKRIKEVERRGKNIILHLSGEVSVLIHQKISGHILFGKWDFQSRKWVSSDKLLSEKINSFIHFVIFLSNGQMIALSDPRKFFKVEFWKKNDLLNSDAIKNLGQDALEISFNDFKKAIGRKQEIKKLLINQSFIAGIGNIYSDEILWDAKISPFRKANSLNDKEIKKLFLSIRKILKKALILKGDSTSDYRLIDGRKGEYQNFHKVYQRDGLPCPRKDGGVIQRKKFGNRSLRFCPVCQK